jgi:hypothetical protein
MVVNEKVDAIPPKPAPTMALKNLLDRCLGVSRAIDFDRPPKHHNSEVSGYWAPSRRPRTGSIPVHCGLRCCSLTGCLVSSLAPRA